MSEKQSVIPISSKAAPESAKDPVRLMIEVAENPNLSREDKAAVIAYSLNRFKNRRRMAYLSLFTILFTIIFLLGAALGDGISDGSDILSKVAEIRTILIWLEGFLISVVAAYYGVTALRPSS